MQPLLLPVSQEFGSLGLDLEQIALAPASPHKWARQNSQEETMERPRAADDFAAIERVEGTRREREQRGACLPAALAARR